MPGNNSGIEMKPRSRYEQSQDTIPCERYRLEDQRNYDRAKYKGKGDVAFVIIPAYNVTESSNIIRSLS